MTKSKNADRIGVENIKKKKKQMVYYHLSGQVKMKTLKSAEV